MVWRECLNRVSSGLFLIAEDKDDNSIYNLLGATDGKVTRWGDINISIVQADWDIESIDSFYNLFYSSFLLDEGVER